MAKAKKSKSGFPNKKGQMQNAETIIVIVIVTIMMLIGLVVVVKNRMREVKNNSEDISVQRAMEVAIVASNMNEIKCSEYTAMIKTCYDYHRLKAFSSVLSKNMHNSSLFYYYLLGNSKVEVKIITGTPENITLYNYNDSANKSSFPVNMPVMVMNSMTKESYFAVMEVRTHS